MGQIAARLPGIIPLSLCLGVDAFPAHKQAKALARLDRLKDILTRAKVRLRFVSQLGSKGNRPELDGSSDNTCTTPAARSLLFPRFPSLSQLLLLLFSSSLSLPSLHSCLPEGSTEPSGNS